ncbi:MAG: hypothetical protein ACFE9L_16260 [Candidatus Hodarchaeota archaeon]
MPENTTLTFVVSKKLKEEFEAQAKALDMTSSYALRRLMQKFITDSSILVHSPSEITLNLEERLTLIQETQERELAKRMNQLDLIIDKARKHLSFSVNDKTKSLTEEIIDLLSSNSDLKGRTYQHTEKLVLEKHPHLKVLIEEAKKRGEDPVSDAINILRDQGFVDYSIRTKRLKWGKK